MVSSVTPARSKVFPVVEIFGPTVQGEGILIGHQTLFVRFGGCDFRCSWCDTMYAVDPEEVKKRSTFMTSREIIEKCLELSPTTEWVTLSGGNPALYDLEQLVVRFRLYGYAVAVETQGSKYKSWMSLCNRVTVSPKPPSSGMPTLPLSLNAYMALPQSVLKIVVLDEADIQYAIQITEKYAHVPLYLQPCRGSPDMSLGAMLEHYTWLANRVMQISQLRHAVILPQLHVLAGLR